MKSFYQEMDIRKNVFIGLNSIIIPGVKIEDNVVIVAGSVVTKSVPGGGIGGVLANIIHKFNDFESKMLSSYVTHDMLDFSVNYRE